MREQGEQIHESCTQNVLQSLQSVEKGSYHLPFASVDLHGPSMLCVINVALKVYLKQLQLCWCSGLKSRVGYPEIATKGIQILPLFPITYLCETELSAVTAMKMKLWSRLDMRNTLCLSLSPITAKWERLVTRKLV